MNERPVDDSVESAIDRVLAAERRARNAVDLCRAEARRAVNGARGRSSRILERADARIGRLQKRCESSVSRRLSELSAEAERIPEQAVVSDEMRRRLQGVIRRLAEEMTSDSAK